MQSSQPDRVNTTSPFPTPSSSPGAVSLAPESEWSNNSEWSLCSSTQSSRVPSPSRQASRCPSPAIANLLPPQLLQVLAHWASTTMPPPGAPQPSSSSNRPSSRPSSPFTKTKVSRPANAFMLYRSHLIKTGQIPKSVEQRQQNISRVAGECWNLLGAEEKASWHLKARELAEKHKAQHPDWKFSPSRKPSRRKAAPEGGAPQPDSEHYIRYIRETYCGVSGPARAPPRPRKSRAHRGVEAHEFVAPNQHARSAPPSPSTSPELTRVASAPPMISTSTVLPHSHLAMDPNAMPAYLTALSAAGYDYFAQYPMQPSEVKDETPKGSSFGGIALPTQPKFTFPSVQSAPCDSGADVDLGLAPTFVAGPSQQDGSLRPETPSKWDLTSFMPLPADGHLADPPMLMARDDTSPYVLDASLDADELNGWF